MSRYNYYGFAPYVSVAQKKINAEKLANKLEKKGEKLTLERYRDYENRLPRGRSYLRHGAVIDLKVKDGAIEALVSGSSLYKVNITIKALKRDRWNALKKECSGKITSLIGLLQGKLPPSVMEAVIKRDSGLFPEPKDISFKCSCPDSAGICKHCAAVVYGVGVRLDDQPELLFLLRGVDHSELITGAGDAAIAHVADGSNDIALDDVGGIFGIELDNSPSFTKPAVPTQSGKKPPAKKHLAKPLPEKVVTKVTKKTAQKVAKKTAKKTAKKVEP